MVEEATGNSAMDGLASRKEVTTHIRREMFSIRPMELGNGESGVFLEVDKIVRLESWHI